MADLYSYPVPFLFRSYDRDIADIFEDLLKNCFKAFEEEQ